MPQILSLYRHPVKGLSPEEVTQARLEAGAYFPADRLYALENGPSGFDPAAPVHQPKIKFLMLMRHEKLARLTTRYEDAAHRLEIRQEGHVTASGDLREVAGRAAIERFFENYMGDALLGPVRLLTSPPGFRFTDSRSGFVSILNRTTIDTIAREAFGKETLDPRRFRGNVVVEGLDAFVENEWIDRKIRLGEVELEVVKRIRRCAATGVDPRTGIRDVEMVEGIMRRFGHPDCGIYARVTRGGVIRPGDQLEAL
ncbi:MAG: MOSC domain-containing protein [Proteobacteria bacterium]|nr:MOSC domain-containing protein [Pseudomonadota bacterium]